MTDKAQNRQMDYALNVTQAAIDRRCFQEGLPLESVPRIADAHKELMENDAFRAGTDWIYSLSPEAHISVFYAHL